LKGLSGYIDGKIEKPAEIESFKVSGTSEVTATTTPPSTAPAPVVPAPMPVYSSTPTLDEWIF